MRSLNVSLANWGAQRRVAALFTIVALLVAGPSAAGAPNDEARAFLLERQVEGTILVEDVESGAVVAQASTGAGWQNGMLPLSETKLMLAAVLSERGVASAAGLDRLIAEGIDDEGRKKALALRRAFGSKTVLRDLAKLGFPPCGDVDALKGPALNCFALSPSTPDAEWASTLSLGETNIRVTPAALSAFLRTVARDGMSDQGRVLSVSAAHALQTAMFDTVRSGTAKGIAPLVLKGLTLGGKTGTGPAQANPYDGLFAGFWFDDKGRPQRTVVVYLRRGGIGGGWPAEIAAELTRLFPTAQVH